jgi:hypothetical protein
VRIRLTVLQATEWQRIGNQIDAATIFARADFVKVFNLSHDFSFSAFLRGRGRLTITAKSV